MVTRRVYSPIRVAVVNNEQDFASVFVEENFLCGGWRRSPSLRENPSRDALDGREGGEAGGAR